MFLRPNNFSDPKFLSDPKFFLTQNELQRKQSLVAERKLLNLRLSKLARAMVLLKLEFDTKDQVLFNSRYPNHVIIPHYFQDKHETIFSSLNLSVRLRNLPNNQKRWAQHLICKQPWK